MAASIKPVRINFWRRRRAQILILVGGLGLLAMLAAGAWAFPHQALKVDSEVAKADVLIVLGGDWLTRPKRAAELFQAGAAPQIICTGYGDAEISKIYLLHAGVPAAAVWLEPKSHTTRENAQFTIAQLRAHHFQSAIIVTSWYHSRRALHCFEHYAPEMHFYSRPSYAAYPRAMWRIKGIRGDIAMEYVKMLGYWVCYGVCPL